MLLVHFVGIPCDMPAIMARGRAARLQGDRGLRHRGRRPLRRPSRRPVRRRRLLLVLSGQAHDHRRGRHVRQPPPGRRRSASRACARSASIAPTPSARCPGMYDVPMLGLNYRMSEMQAALGPQRSCGGCRESCDRAAATSRRCKASAGERAGRARHRRHRCRRPSNSHYCLIAVLRRPLAGRRNDFVRAPERRGRRHQRATTRSRCRAWRTTARSTATTPARFPVRRRSATARSRCRWARICAGDDVAYIARRSCARGEESRS